LVHWVIALVLLGCLWHVGSLALGETDPVERTVAVQGRVAPSARALAAEVYERAVDRRVDERNEPVHAVPLEDVAAHLALPFGAVVAVARTERVHRAVSAHGPRAPPAG
jgi:hypothetical protein